VVDYPEAFLFVSEIRFKTTNKNKNNSITELGLTDNAEGEFLLETSIAANPTQ